MEGGSLESMVRLLTVVAPERLDMLSAREAAFPAALELAPASASMAAWWTMRRSGWAERAAAAAAKSPAMVEAMGPVAEWGVRADEGSERLPLPAGRYL